MYFKLLNFAEICEIHLFWWVSMIFIEFQWISSTLVSFENFVWLKMHFLIMTWKFRYYSFKNLLRGVRSRCANRSNHLEVLQTIPALWGGLTFFALFLCVLLSVSFRDGRITNPASHCSINCTERVAKNVTPAVAATNVAAAMFAKRRHRLSNTASMRTELGEH